MPPQSEHELAPARPRRANDLDGRTWQRYSISIWSDIRKTPEEMRLRHPAMFPVALVTRLIQCLTTHEDRVIVDPFAGTGATLVAAELMGRVGIGLEISPAYCEMARTRPLPTSSPDGAAGPPPAPGERRVYCDDARHMLRYVGPGSVDLCVTSPPYWDILLRRRTADGKPVGHYGESTADLGKIASYPAFLAALGEVFRQVFE
ncbi:MAG: DNA methyltransferase, partial [Firmicutes bacterium]|nr:DNA methyltransferase [Bacillota bacterium]